MKLRAIAEKVNASRPAVRLRSCRAAGVLRSFTGLCRENPFPVQCIFLLIYRAVLDFMYLTQLSPIYTYRGFTTDLNLATYGLSWLLLLAFLPLIAGIQGQEDRPSAILVTLINLLYFVPMTSYMGCKGSTFWFIASVAVYWLVLLLLQLRLPSFTLKRIPLHHGRLLFLVLTVGAVLLVMGVSGVYTGFRLKLNISDVYSVRTEAASYDIPTVLSYVLSWMTMVLSVLILYWLQRKKYLIAAGLIVVYFFYYSIGAHKSIFLFLFLTLACYFLYRSWMYRWAAGFLSLAALVTWMLQAGSKSVNTITLLLHRTLYTPVRMSEMYAVYFSQHPLNLLREGFLDRLFFSPIYSTQIPKVIGEFINTGEHANNGMIGDMYANLPVLLGVIFYPLILVIIFRLFDMATCSMQKTIVISFCVFFSFSFTNGAWGTILLSGGFLLACGLLYLFPAQQGGLKP